MFEAFEMIMNRLESTGDASVSIWHDEIIVVTLEDFDGFDSNYAEIAREYEDREMVEALMELLKSCDTVEDEDDWRVYHLIENHKVYLTYASEDI